MQFESRVYNIANNQKLIGMVASESLYGPVVGGCMDGDEMKI